MDITCADDAWGKPNLDATTIPTKADARAMSTT
jgi:hypothetical protein